MEHFKLSMGAIRHLNFICHSKVYGNRKQKLQKLSAVMKTLSPMIKHVDDFKGKAKYSANALMGTVGRQYSNNPEFVNITGRKIMDVESYLENMDNLFLFYSFDETLIKFIKKLIKQARKDKYLTSKAGVWRKGQFGDAVVPYMELVHSFDKPIKPEDKDLFVKKHPNSVMPDLSSIENFMQVLLAGTLGTNNLPTSQYYDEESNTVDSKKALADYQAHIASEQAKIQKAKLDQIVKDNDAKIKKDDAKPDPVKEELNKVAEDRDSEKGKVDPDAKSGDEIAIERKAQSEKDKKARADRRAANAKKNKKK